MNHTEQESAAALLSVDWNVLKRAALLATIQSVMSQQVFSIIPLRQNPCCDITDRGRDHKYNMPDSFYPQKEAQRQFKRTCWCSLVVHNAQMWYAVSWDIFFMEAKHCGNTEYQLEPDLLKAKAIKVCSELNGWVHYNLLQEGMWLLRKDHRGCAANTSTHSLCLCLKQRHIVSLILNILSFKT